MFTVNKDTFYDKDVHRVCLYNFFYSYIKRHMRGVKSLPSNICTQHSYLEKKGAYRKNKYIIVCDAN